MFESLNRIDWDLLHRQKRVLVEEASKDRLKPSVAEALWGIVHLLDALQDDAVAARTASVRRTSVGCVCG